MSDRPIVAVGGIVLERRDRAPRVVLIKRARPPSLGRWSLPGGRVERGERLADALAREVREEAGVDVLVGPLVEVVEIIEPPFHYVILDYACSIVGGELCAGDDASEAALVPVDELPRYGVTDLVARVVAKALAVTEADAGAEAGAGAEAEADAGAGAGAEAEAEAETEADARNPR